MKLAPHTGSQGSPNRRNALLWLLLVLAVALNCHLILRGLVSRGGDGLLSGGRDHSGSFDALNNIILSDTTQVHEEANEGGARGGGVMLDDQGHPPLPTRVSRKEGGDSAGSLVHDSSGGWATSAKKLEADRKGERLFTTSANSPGVPDLYAYVEAYWDSMANTRMVSTLEEASKMYVCIFECRHCSLMIHSHALSPALSPALPHALAGFFLCAGRFGRPWRILGWRMRFMLLP